MIETDKVNVEVRAPSNGVLLEVLAGVDDDGKSSHRIMFFFHTQFSSCCALAVAVGAGLFKIDTEGETSASVAPALAAAPASAPPAPEAAASHGTREVAIKFLGKAGWAARLNSVVHDVAVAPAPVEVLSVCAAVAHSTGALDSWMLPAGFGVTPITQEEIDAVDLGGASLVA